MTLRLWGFSSSRNRIYALAINHEGLYANRQLSKINLSTYL